MVSHSSPNKRAGALPALVFIAHGIQCRTLKYLQIVKRLLPSICKLPIQQRICRFVAQPDCAAHANLPLCGQPAEQLHHRPVFRPDFDFIAVEVFQRQAGAGQLCGRCRPLIQCSGGAFQFPSTPSLMAFS